jgi:glycerol kinase
MPFILALDQGTTSSRAVLFDRAGVPRAIAQREIRQIYPQPGWVEHDPEEIWASQGAVAQQVLERTDTPPANIAAIGITNQRETTIVWDRATGRPACNAIVWQDRRTAGLCDRLKADGAEPLVRAKTGLVIDAYFSASKLAWILDAVPGARADAEAGRLAFGTVDTWLTWKLTGGARHVTDASNAARTMLFNIHTGEWDDELLRLFNVPRVVLPDVRPNGEVFGEAAEFAGRPIAGLAGDQQAALFGQACLRPGMAKNTYGTGCFLLQHTGRQPVESRNRLLTTVAWDRGGVRDFALEGSVFIGGAVVQWLRDGLGVIRDSVDVEALAAAVPDSGGVVFVPAFAGLGAPHWDAYGRGAILGMTRGTTAGHVARAALDGIAFQVADVLDAMAKDSGTPLTELRVDGGASRNDLLLQFQADLLGVPVVRAAVPETTALGAAFFAGLAVGYWGGHEEIAALWRADRRFEPRVSREHADALRGRWRRAVDRAAAWETPGDG